MWGLYGSMFKEDRDEKSFIILKHSAADLQVSDEAVMVMANSDWKLTCHVV